MNGGVVCVEMNKLRCYFYLHVRRKTGEVEKWKMGWDYLFYFE
jgi:hypothetical protein